MEYRDFVDGLNSGKIIKAVFSVQGYSHYRNCVVESKLNNPGNNDSGKSMWFYLTPDGYEKTGFLNTMKEKTKLFRIKNGGTYTLLQMWDKIDIQFVEYSQK